MTSENGHVPKPEQQAVPAQRDIRVTALRPLRRALRQGSLVSATSAFVDALLARYLGHNPTSQRLGLIFLRPQAGPTVQHGGSRLHVNIAPRLQLTLVQYGAAAQSGPIASTNPSWSLNRPASTPVVTQIVRRLYRRERLQPGPPIQTARRLLERSVPVHAVAKPGLPATLPTAAKSTPSPQTPGVLRAPAPAAQPVPRIVARVGMRPSGAEEGTAHRAAGRTAGEPLPGVARRSEVSAQATPTLDINRVAEQVMQQIDRRILAHRERTGRI